MRAEHHVAHRRQRSHRPPAHVGRLVVGDVRLALDPGAGEGEVEVGRAVAVGVHDLAVDGGGGEPVDPDPDAGLLQRLARRGDGGLLAGVDDARDRRPVPVVGALDQQHLVAAAYDGGDAGQPERVVADLLAERDHEVGDRAHDSQRLDHRLLEVADPLVDVVRLGPRVVLGQRVPVVLVAGLDAEPGGQREPDVGEGAHPRLGLVGRRARRRSSARPRAAPAGRPASSRVSMISAAAPALPSRSPPSVKRRKSAAASSSSG